MVVAAFGAAAAEPHPLEALERAQQEIYARVAPSVVLLATPTSLGSGVAVGPGGLVLTNRHVVGKATRLEAVLLDGRRASATLVRAAEDLDLALVSVAAEVPVATLTRGAPVHIGAWVASVGHGAGGGWTFTTGMVTNIYPAGQDRAVFQTQLPVNAGNSGGPVLDREGRAIGVVTAGLTESDSINFAIRMEEAFRAFPELDAVCGCLVVTAPANVPVFVDGAHAGTGPRLVLWPAPGVHEASAVVDGRLARVPFSFPEVHAVRVE